MPAAPTVNPLGEMVLECDREKGEIYVRPVGVGTKPINLFVSSDHATYTLLLKRADMPADTIVIRDKTPRRAAPGEGQIPGRLADARPYISAASRPCWWQWRPIALQRISGSRKSGGPIQLWAEARLSLMRLYEGRGLIGEKYLITNVSDKTMVLAEQEFDREDGDVVAVSVENHNLRPNDSTNVYVIRSGS